MKAAVFDGKNLTIKQVPIPKLNPDQVLIKIKKSGICGTDLSIISGTLPTPIPIIPGHEFSGEIVEVYPNEDKNSIGKRVSCEINSNICGVCVYCINENHTNCIKRKALGIDIDGAFAEFIAIDKNITHELPSNITYEQGTFIEPLAAAINTFELMPITSNDELMVIYGAGKMGLLILQVCKNLPLLYPRRNISVPKVVIVSRSDFKLRIAHNLGADHIINNSKEDPVQKIMDLTDQIGADVVVESTGSANVIDQVLNSTKTRGSVALKSTHGIKVPFNITDVVVRELSLFGTRCGPFDKSIEFMNSGKVKVQDLVSARFNLDDIEKALNLTKNPNIIKIIIENNE